MCEGVWQVNHSPPTHGHTLSIPIMERKQVSLAELTKELVNNGMIGSKEPFKQFIVNNNELLPLISTAVETDGKFAFKIDRWTVKFESSIKDLVYDAEEVIISLYKEDKFLFKNGTIGTITWIKLTLPV